MKLLFTSFLALTLLKASTINANPAALLECLMVQFDGICEDDLDCADKEGWRVFCDDDTLYFIDGLSSEVYMNSKSAETVLSVTGAKKIKTTAMNPNTLMIPPGSIVSTKRIEKGSWKTNGGRKLRRQQQQNRQLVQNQGTSSILVVRVTDETGDDPPHSAAQLSDDIFGTAGDPHNLKSQFAACSGDKLNFVPATGTGIVNGVGELTIPYTITGVTAETVEGWVDTAVSSAFPNWYQYTHVMYVLPKSVNFGGSAAYAYMGWYKSVFMAGYATKLLVQLHEFGHNLDLMHSGYNDVFYGDQSGYLGNAAQQDDYPLMCFNAAKSWALGWYSENGKEGHVTLPTGTSSWGGALVGVDDYVKDNGFVNGEHRVVVKIESPTASNYDNLYMMYNRKKGVNSQVIGHGDKVTIVATSTMDGQSWLEASITEADVGGKRFNNWDGSGNDLVVEVCDRVYGAPDYADVIVYIDDGANNLSCISATTPPSASPTTMPSAAPSKLASASPTTSMVPTTSPTTSPSKMPSAAPSKLASASPTTSTVPTTSPSASPTKMPSAAPSKLASASPTTSTAPSASPSVSHSKMPSAAPSKLASASPTTSEPTTSPSGSPTKMPSASPTKIPTASPTTSEPTTSPTASPSTMPTASPSKIPTASPTTSEPTLSPSASPTKTPSAAPSFFPTSSPIDCALQKVDESCVEGFECCSGSCSSGKPSRRVCLPGASTPAPVESSTPAPIGASTPAPVSASTPAPVGASTPAPVSASTPAPVPASTPAPVGGNCETRIGVQGTCREAVDCCSGVCSGGKPSRRSCIA